MDRQNEGIEDAAELRLILLDMGGLLPQNEGKHDWPSYSYKTFPLVYLPDPRIAQIQADLTPQDVHKLCLLSRNQIKPVSRILAISGILGHFQQKYLGRNQIENCKKCNHFFTVRCVMYNIDSVCQAAKGGGYHFGH